MPNVAGLPYLAGASLAQRQAAQRAAVGMTTTVVNPLVSQGVAVVDSMCDGRSYLPSNYSSDGLHPNDAGYAFIASEVVRAMTTSVVSGAAEHLRRHDDRAVGRWPEDDTPYNSDRHVDRRNTSARQLVRERS